MPVLTREIKTFEDMQESLEQGHFGKWVLIVGDQLVGTYETFQDAAVDASHRFGRGPYLIRQVVGAITDRLSSAAVFGRGYAND